MSKVLLIEDDDIIRMATESTLASSGHEVRAAGSGEEAIRIAASFSPEVLITDWRLEGPKDGIHVARELHEQFPSLVILVQTGYSPDRVLHASEGLPISQVLVKPVPLDELSAIVESAVARRETTL